MTQSDQNNRQNVVYTLLVVMIGQVGCLTIVVILASVLGGLWLDATFGTGRVFTLILLFAGIPLSVFLMMFTARKTLARLMEKYETKEKKETTD